MTEPRYKVRDKRKQLGLTQKDVADQAGISLRAYQMFEGGKSTPQGGNLRAIYAVVGMDDLSEQEVIAETTRETFPRDVRAFLDIIGAWLSTFADEEREDRMRELGRHIFNSRT